MNFLCLLFQFTLSKLPLSGPTWHQSRDGSVLLASRRYNASRSRKTKGSLADTLQCNIWRRAQTAHRMTHCLHGGGNNGNGFTALGKKIGTSKSTDTDADYVTEHRALKYLRPKIAHYLHDYFGLSCHDRRRGQEHPDRLKLCPRFLRCVVCKAHLRMLKSGLYFLVFWCAKDEPKARFQSLGIWWCWGRIHHKLAQSFDHGRLLNVAFGSSQTDDWLPRYGHLKFWGGVVLQVMGRGP